MNTSLTVFVVASLVVVAALVYPLWQWLFIRKGLSGAGKVAASLFVACFALYAVGQGVVIAQVLNWLPRGDVSSYLYALAALLFAVGSYYQRKSLRLLTPMTI